MSRYAAAAGAARPAGEPATGSEAGLPEPATGSEAGLPGPATPDDDEQSFSAWAAAAWPRLVRTATALTAGDHHLAEDLAQTALARTYLAWGRVRHDLDRGQHPDRYVHRVLVRAFIDETRRPWWRRVRVGAPVQDLPVSGGLDPEDREAVRLALAALPPDQRAAVVLRHWLGADVQECARLLGCPAATVRTRTFRGLSRLRELLGADLESPEANAELGWGGR